MNRIPLDTLVQLLAEARADEEIAYDMYALRQDSRDLPPEKHIDAFGRHVHSMAQKGFADGSGWLDALDIADTARAALLGRALFTAVIYNGLSKSEALEIIDGWPDSPVRQETRRNIVTS